MMIRKTAVLTIGLAGALAATTAMAQTKQARQGQPRIYLLGNQRRYRQSRRRQARAGKRAE
jgi:hypothetical protein